MKILATFLAGAALAAGLAAPANAKTDTRAERNEARLAKMLEGRTAGEPVRCITDLRGGNAMQVLEHVGVVYDAGDTIYVARPRNPKALGAHDALIIDRFGSQLCTTDMVRTFDRNMPGMSGVVFFEDFVPYRKG